MLLQRVQLVLTEGPLLAVVAGREGDGPHVPHCGQEAWGFKHLFPQKKMSTKKMKHKKYISTKKMKPLFPQLKHFKHLFPQK